MKELFSFTFDDEYELALKVGKERFGSVCNHENVRNGKRVFCCRKLISRLVVVKSGK